MDVLLIIDGVVDNCICADSVERAQEIYPDQLCMERTPDLAHVGPGHLYDGTSFTAPPPPPKTGTVLTQVEFLKRIPMVKRINIRAAANTDGVIKDAMELLVSAPTVHTNDPDLRYFVAYLVQYGYLTQADANALLE
jgi:hypothetical protein